MVQRVQLPNGTVAEFPDGMTAEQIQAAIGGLDPRSIAPDRSIGEAVSDPVVGTGAALIDAGGNVADMAQPDAAPLANAPGTRAARFELMARDIPVIGGMVETVGRVKEAGGNALATLGDVQASLIERFGPKSAQPMAASNRDTAARIRDSNQTARDAENARRAAAGELSLEDETKTQFATSVAGVAGEYADSARESLSDETKADKAAIAGEFDKGLWAGAKNMITSPLDTANAFGPDVAAFLLGGGIAGRGLKAAGATDELATMASAQAQGGVASTLNAEGAADAVRSLSEEQLLATPMAQELQAEGRSPAEIRDIMARRAGDAALTLSLPANVALMGASTKLGLNVADRAAAGARPGFGQILDEATGAAGRAGRTLMGGAKEFASEAVEGGADQLSQNFGEVAGGVRSADDITKGVGTAAVMEGIIGGGVGGGAGALASPTKVADILTTQPTDTTDPAGQAQRDVAEIYAAAKRGAFTGPPQSAQAPAAPAPAPTAAAPGPIAAPAAAPAPQPAAPASPAPETGEASGAGRPAPVDLTAGQDPLDALAGLDPEIRAAAGPGGAEAMAALQQQGGTAPTQSRRRGLPPPPPAKLPAAGPALPPPATAPRGLSRADMVAPPPVASRYAKGVPSLLPGDEAKPYLKANIDTLPDPTPEQLPTDSSARYFSAKKGDAVVPLSQLRPTKSERVATNALKRMAATAAGVIERRDPIDVRLLEDGTYEIIDGNGSFAAAEQIGLRDMPVRIVEAPKGSEGWRMPRGMLAPESDAALTAAYELAESELPAYRSTLEGLGQRLGGEAIIAPLKGRTRAEEKVSEDYNGDISKLSDLLRGTVVFDTPEAALAAASEIRGTMTVVKDKDTLAPGTKDKGFGYRDINLVVQMPGGSKAEIQLMTRAMADAKAMGHKHYEATRTLDRKISDGTATPAEIMRFDRAVAAQKKLYAEAGSLASSATNSARVSGDQESGLSTDVAASPEMATASPDGRNLVPDTGVPGDSVTNANTSESLRPMNTTSPPAGGTVTPANTSDTAESSAGDGDIVQDSPIGRAVSALLAKLEIPAGKVRVLASPKDLPKAVSSRGLDGQTEGIYHEGTVYLFAGAISDPARAIWVTMHEFAGHNGLRSLLPGDQLAKLLDEAGTNPLLAGIARAMKAEADAERARGAAGAREIPLSGFLEEAIAEVAAAMFTGDMDALVSRYGAGMAAETDARAAAKAARGTVQKIIDAVKRFAFNAGAPMSDAQVIDLIRNAYKATRSGSAGVAGTPQSRSIVNPEIEFEVAPDGAVSVLEGIDELRELLAERGITDKGKLAKGRLTFTVNQSPRILATIAGETNAASRAGVVYEHVIKDGKVVGAPPQFDTEAKLPAMREAIEKLALEGESGRFWYENSGRAVLQMVGGNKEDARKFMQLVAIYSPQADIAPNFVFALRAWLQIKAGKPVNVKTGAQDRNAEAVVRDGKPWTGEKTNNFYNNLMRAVDPEKYGADVQGVTGDMWMARAFQYETDAPNDSQYRFIEIETNRLAQKLGWEPQHAQAAIWVALKTRMNGDRSANRAVDEASIAAGDLKIVDGARQFSGAEGAANHRRRWLEDALTRQLTPELLRVGEYNYSNAMRDYLGQISWEARPGRTAGGPMQWVNDAPFEVQAAYQEEIHQALLGRDGEDLLASQLGLPVVDYAAAPGVWQGEVAAGGQSVITLPLRKKAKDYAKDLARREAAGEEISGADRNLVDPDAQNMVTAYAAILGRLLRQEGMGWHRPDYATSKRDANGVEIRAGRVLTGEETLRFYGELDGRARERGGSADDFAIISTPDGLRVLNFGSVQNPVFHEMIESAATRAIDHDDIAVELFRSDGNLISNDWKEDTDGQGYLRAAAEAGHRSAAEWADRVLAPRIEAANRAFAGRYGRDVEAGTPQAEVSAAPQSRAAAPVPGTPTPLYVARPVTDDGGLRRWAEAAGLSGVLPMSEMHVTVTYSRAPVDVIDAPPAGGDISASTAGRPIKLRSALAMPVLAPQLESGHRRYRAAGASHDYGSDYTPHVTIKYDATEEEVATLRAAAPFTGTIKLGPEEQAVLNPGDETPAEAPMQSRAATQAARQTAAQLRERKSQLARELTTQFVTAEQLRAWTNRARILIGEVSVSPDFAQDLKDARRELTPERRATLAGDREALKRYDEIRDMMALIEDQQRTVRAKAAEANRLIDKAERRSGSMSLKERELLVDQLAESLDAAESAYIAAKRVADWRASNDYKVIKAHQKRNDVLGFLAAEGYQQGSFLWDTSDPIKARGETVRRKIRRALQDKMIDVRDVQREIESQLGRSLDDAQNVYRAENQMHGKVADGIEKFRQTMVEPLKAAIKATGMSVAEVEAYLWARHATERNAKIRAINPGVDDGSGMSDADAAAKLATYTPAQLKQLEAIGARVEAIRRHTLETLVKAGQLERGQADTILASYQNYVPLRADKDGEARVGGTGQGISAAGAGVQRALGRKTPPKNILAELVGDSERAVVQAGKAEVGRALLRLVLSYPNPALWSVEPVILEPKFNEATGEVYLAIATPDDAESIVVKHNGKPYRVQIKHPQLVAALRNTGTEGAEWIVRYLGKVNRWLSAVFTRFNPGFVPVNLARDMFQGLTGVLAELGTESLGKVLANYPKAVAATYLDARSQRGDASKPDAQKTMADWTREFSEAGGKTGWTAIDDMDTLQADIENSMMSLVDVARTRPLDVLGEAFSRSTVIQAIENANDSVENAIRVATYAHLRKDKGWSREKAAEYAKEMTVNFNRKGASGSVINALYLFFNAGMQGSRRTLMLMRHPKVAAVLGGLATGQALLAASLGMVKYDEDDEETLWEQIPDHVKRRSFVIPWGFDEQGNARWFSIPMPFGFNVFPAVGGYAANYMSESWRGKQEAHFASAFGYLTSTAIDAVSPVAVGEEGGMWPTIAQMGLEMARNRDSLGRRIGQSEDFATYETPRASMSTPGTAEPFKWAALALNRIGGGDDYNKPKILDGLLDVSPNDLEYLFNQFAGGPGSTVTGFYRTVTREVAAGDAKPFELPIVKSVVGGARRESIEARRFYENKDRIERNLDRLKDAYAEGGAEKYAEVQAELGPAYADVGLRVRKRTTDNGRAGEVMTDPNTGRPEFALPADSMVKMYRTAARDVTEIASEMRRVYNDSTMDPVARSARLIELQRERADAVKALNRRMSAEDAAAGRRGE